MIIKPFISIITISYNSSLFIEQCITSVINQDYHNYEYIIIDGGSDDGTVDIIKKYQHHLSYWHSRPDRGLSHAFNMGLEHANGQWIAFLNSDDFYSNKNVFKIVADELKKDRSSGMSDIAYGQIRLINRNNDNEFISPAIGKEWSWGKMRRYSSIPHPATFANRNLFDQLGVFDENYSNALDYEFFLRKGKDLKARFIPIVFAYMRTGGMSNAASVKSLKESRDAQIKNRADARLIVYIWWLYLRLRRAVKNGIKALCQVI